MTNIKNKTNKTSILTVDKCMEQVDMTDYYITRNILKIVENKKNFEFIKSNIFLLSINNKNNKNALMILLENGKYKLVKELIDYNYEILNYKNIYENNLFKLLLTYDYFYDLILNLIEKLERKYVIHIITCKNKYNQNFIDNLIVLLNSNCHFYYSTSADDIEKKKLLDKLIVIVCSIYLLDIEKYIFMINKLCKVIKDQKFLMDIFKKIQVDNLDIYPDNNLLSCIDYLIYNEYFDVLVYLLDKINYIEFTNIDDNVIFKLCDNQNIDNKTKANIIINILYKSNIAKFKNNKNQNIFYWLITNYDIKIKTITNFIDYINIYEQDIYGKTLFDLIENKYDLKDIQIIKKHFSTQFIDKKIFERTYKKINIKNKLIKSDIGIFTSNVIHNMIYTIYILNSYPGIIKIPNFTLTQEKINKYNELIEISNNEKSISGYIKLYFNTFTQWMPHLIIWKNKFNYWIDPHLIDYLTNNRYTPFIHIKLTVYLINDTSIRHSNVIIIDNVNNIVERFEPYGEIIFTNSVDINNMIKTQIALPLGYKFIFSQPYPGFQSRSDEFAKYNKSYGDPMGFCLAWSFLYIDIKMKLFENKINMNPIDFINWYIINKFSKDFSINTDVNKTNKYILFIRFYSRHLDNEKNKIIKKIGLDPSLTYQNDLAQEYQTKLIDGINDKLNLFL